MAITKNIVEMMNGTISVDSEKGVGSTFTVNVTLRCSERSDTDQIAEIRGHEFRQSIDRQQQKADSGGEKADLTGRRILLAEDMLINAEIMIELLEMMEIQVEHTENGRLTVERFSEKPEGYFDAILMDMRMPEMDGLTAAKTIRALDREDAKKIPIIALTANAFDEDVQRSLQAGMNAHLSKPVEPERLYETLAELIHN